MNVTREVARAALWPAALLYGAAAALRRGAYQRGWLARERLRVPVVSIGGVAVGGEGKTPVARLVAERLTMMGARVGIVTGGYGSSSWRRQGVHLSAALCEPLAAARLFGDESLLHARWHPQAIVTCGEKTSAARLAVELGADVVVLDDGLQHLELARDLDIVVHAGTMMPAPLPRGDGREPWQLIHPDIWWRHQRAGGCDSGVDDVVDDVVSRNRPLALTTVDGLVVGGPEVLEGRPVFLLAGIARPEDFGALVRSQRAEIVGQRFVRDHRQLTGLDIELARRSGALMLCTEKDAVKLRGAAASVRDLLVLCCEPQIVHGDVLLCERLRSLFG